jgi:hypothetical protein
MIELEAPDGTPFVRERVELARAKGTFRQRARFTDPVSMKVLPNAMYRERVEATVVGSSMPERV